MQQLIACAIIVIGVALLILSKAPVPKATVTNCYGIYIDTVDTGNGPNTNRAIETGIGKVKNIGVELDENNNAVK